jgi:hypothetical protein
MGTLGAPTFFENHLIIHYFVTECQDLDTAGFESVGVLSIFLNIQDGE